LSATPPPRRLQPPARYRVNLADGLERHPQVPETAPAGNHLAQQLETLRITLGRLKSDACDPTAGAREAGHYPHRHGVLADNHYDGCRARRLHRGIQRLLGYREDRISSRSIQLMRKGRQPVSVALGVALYQFEVSAKLEPMLVQDPQQLAAPSRRPAGRWWAIAQQTDAIHLLGGRRRGEREQQDYEQCSHSIDPAQLSSVYAITSAAGVCQGSQGSIGPLNAWVASILIAWECCIAMRRRTRGQQRVNHVVRRSFDGRCPHEADV
jgi:hypothetical protein